MKKRKEYTKEEIDFLKENINKLTYDDMAIILDREKSNICRKCKSLGIEKNTNCSTTLIEKQPKYKFTKEDISKSINTNREKFDKGLHPRGNLGHKHSIETREKLSQCSRRGWEVLKNDNQKLKEWKTNQRNTKIKNGTLNPIKIKENSYSRTKGGKRADLNNQYFRSAWEANIARYYNFLGVKWEYEPKTFIFENIRRGSVSYTPDFYLVEEDKWIEVKGWMDKKSKTKLNRFKKYYPDEYKKLVLIQEKEYKEIKRKISHFIENWE